VTDDRGIDIEGVDTSVDRTSKRTERAGTAVYNPVTVGPHTVDAVLAKAELQKEYEALALPSHRPVTVVAGQIAYVPYQILRKPLLRVKVRCTGDGQLVGAATISIDGPENASVPTHTATGVAEFGRVKSGPYGITVKLSDKSAERYATTLDFTKAKQDVTLAVTEEREVVVDVEQVNVVASHIKLDKNDLYIDDGEGADEARTAKVDLRLEQSNMAHPYAKDVTFTCETNTDVEACFDNTFAKPLDGIAKGVVIGGSEGDALRKGDLVSVYLRAKTTEGPLKVSLTLADPGDRFVKYGDQAKPVDAQVHVLARPHVNIKWLDGSGYDANGDVTDVSVSLAANSLNHIIPQSLKGVAKWALSDRGIKPNLYQCSFTFADNVRYLLHDESGVVVKNPSLDLKPNGQPVTFKIARATLTLAIECFKDKDRQDVAVAVKLKTAPKAVRIERAERSKALPVPIVEENQKAEIESIIPDGTEVYEFVDASPT